MAGVKKKSGGNRKGAGRPKGSTTRPQLRDFYTQEEIEEFVSDLKQSAKTDSVLKKFIAEQIFGKAIQAMEISGKDGTSLFNAETKQKSKEATSAFIKGASGKGITKNT